MPVEVRARGGRAGVVVMGETGVCLDVSVKRRVSRGVWAGVGGNPPGVLRAAIPVGFVGQRKNGTLSIDPTFSGFRRFYQQLILFVLFDYCVHIGM